MGMKHPLDWWRDMAAADPKRLASEILVEIEQLEPSVKSAAIRWTPTIDDLANAIAKGVATKGPLAGLPYALKDLFDFVGAPTTAGSSFLQEVRPTPSEDALIVRRLRELGAAMAAKTGTVEFAYGLSGENLHFGDVPHPHINGALAGGSSSGSAWAVGAGLTPFGIGTDTAGSMRVPAAYCGLYAWRDAPGPYTQQGCFPLAPTFDTPGWFAADPETLLLLNDALLETSPDIDQARVLDLSSLCPNLSPELGKAGQKQLRKLGATVDPDATLLAQNAFVDSARAYNILGSCEAFQIHQAWLDDYRERYDPVIWERIDRARHWSEEDIAWARAKEAQIHAALEELFRQYDALALPVTPVASPGKAAMTEDYRSELLSLTTPGSIGRCPVLTIPLHVANSLSGGLQILLPKRAAPAIARLFLKH